MVVDFDYNRVCFELDFPGNNMGRDISTQEFHVMISVIYYHPYRNIINIIISPRYLLVQVE